MFNSYVSAFAPVNIAWIKYMGKELGKPTNSSLSLTLATLGTRTSMKIDPNSSGLGFEWDQKAYLPPLHGQKKVEDFLLNQHKWKSLLSEFGFEAHFPESKVLIETHNNVPAGTGIATSASAFAALTLVWSALLSGSRSKDWIELYQSGNPKLRRSMAAVAASGSGSSCRSLDGPWVEWNPDQGISVIDGGVTEWMDFVFILESGPKAVPSSEAHARVKTSPNFLGRVERANARLLKLKSLLKETPQNFKTIQKLVLEESMDMHDLFHTSEPSFRYMNEVSEELITAIQKQTFHGVITLDAGANVHLFVPVNEEAVCEKWIQTTYPQLKYLKDVTGYGAHYE